jgi:hypothetical protein
MKRKTIKELGLNEDSLLDPEKAMEYWLQLEPQEFLISMIHEIRQEQISTKFFIEIVAKDERVSHMALSALLLGEATKSEKETVKFICDAILNENARLSKVLDVMWRYAHEKEDI